MDTCPNHARAPNPERLALIRRLERHGLVPVGKRPYITMDRLIALARLEAK